MQTSVPSSLLRPLAPNFRVPTLAQPGSNLGYDYRDGHKGKRCAANFAYDQNIIRRLPPPSVIHSYFYPGRLSMGVFNVLQVFPFIEAVVKSIQIVRVVTTCLVEVKHDFCVKVTHYLLTSLRFRPDLLVRVIY